MLHAMDGQYTITEQSRKNIAYDCMPPELQKILDSELARGHLQDWQSMRDFLINFSDSFEVGKNTKPAPIAANVNDEPKTEPTDEPQYTEDEWCYFLNSPEGQTFAMANPGNTNVQQFLLSVVMKG